MNKIYRKSLPLLVLALSAGLFSSIINGYISLLMRDMIDLSFLPGQPGFLQKGIRIILFSGLLLVVQSILALAKGVYRRKTNLNLKTEYLRRVFGKNINEFNQESNAKYVSHMTNDLNTVDMDFIDSIFELSLSLMAFLVSLVIIGGLSLEVLLVIIGVTVLTGLLSNALARPVKTMFSERSALYEKYTEYLNEVLHAFRIIRVNNLYGKIRDNFEERSRLLQDKSYKIEKTSTYIFAAQNFTINLTVLGVLGVSVYYAITGKLSFGGIILILTNFQNLMGPFHQASELFPKIVSAKGLFKILDRSLENAEENVEDQVLPAFTQSITLDGVSYAYGENRVLEGVNLTLEKGKKYLIVGPSGGGKSTLLKLLRKYFSPQEGTIWVDGLDLRRITKESYFQVISNVEQSVFMFDDTLRSNLTLHRTIGEEDLKSAIVEAGLQDFVEKLPQGLDTVIEDNGRNISGGEKSRIAIARALLNQSQILILDEAFQSLDYVTAREIEGTILRIPSLTVLNVSHIIIPENKDRYDGLLHVDNKTVTPRRG